MKKFIFTLSLLNLFTITAATAQVAKWVIHPSYNHIRMLGDGYYIVSQDDKYGILDATEKEIVPLQYDSISPTANASATPATRARYTISLPISIDSAA